MSRKQRLKEVPTWLKHKPIYVINYQKNNRFFENDTDVIGLSLGKAQWSEDNFVPSVKVWRDVQNNQGYRISRQSEETTLTRALDLATLVVKVYDCYASNKAVNSQIMETDTRNIFVETVGSNEMLKQLKVFLSNEKLADIKSHIEILKKTIEKIKL